MKTTLGKLYAKIEETRGLSAWLLHHLKLAFWPNHKYSIQETYLVIILPNSYQKLTQK